MQRAEAVSYALKMTYFDVAKADKESVKRVMTTFTHFANLTGLVANTAKTEMVIAGAEEEVMQRLLKVTGFQKGEFPFRYPGVPVTPEANKE